MLTSRREVIGKPSFSLSIFRRFKATISSVLLSCALYTTPYVPSSILIINVAFVVRKNKLYENTHSTYLLRHWNSLTLRHPIIAGKYGGSSSLGSTTLNTPCLISLMVKSSVESFSFFLRFCSGSAESSSSSRNTGLLTLSWWCWIVALESS